MKLRFSVFAKFGRLALFLVAAAAHAGGADPGQASSALSAALPFKRDAADSMPPSLWWLLAVLLIGLALSLAYRHRRRFTRPSRTTPLDWRRWLAPPPSGSDLRTLSSVQLDLRTTLHDIEWHGKRMLIASHEHGVTVLAERAGSRDGAFPATDSTGRT
jgi:hypothetical protein